MLAARHQVFSKVLAARKSNLITARARKYKRTALMLANTREDHSIPLTIHHGTREQLRVALTECVSYLLGSYVLLRFDEDY